MTIVSYAIFIMLNYWSFYFADTIVFIWDGSTDDVEIS